MCAVPDPGEALIVSNSAAQESVRPGPPGTT